MVMLYKTAACKKCVTLQYACQTSRRCLHAEQLLQVAAQLPNQQAVQAGVVVTSLTQ